MVYRSSTKEIGKGIMTGRPVNVTTIKKVHCLLWRHSEEHVYKNPHS